MAHGAIGGVLIRPSPDGKRIQFVCLAASILQGDQNRRQVFISKILFYKDFMNPSFPSLQETKMNLCVVGYCVHL